MDIDRSPEQVPAWLGNWLSDMDSGQSPTDVSSEMDDEEIPDAAITSPDDELGEAWDGSASQPSRFAHSYHMGPSYEDPTEPEPRSWWGFVKIVEPKPMDPKVDMNEVDPDLISDNRRPNVLTKEQLGIAKAADEATAEACEIWSEVSGKPVEEIQTTSGSCQEVSIVAGGILKATTGMDTKMLQFFPNALGPGRGWHFLLETQTGSPDGELEIDATWKQMVDLWQRQPEYDNQPDVLVVPRLELPSALSAHGIPAFYQNTWIEAVPMRWDWRDFPREGIKSAMKAVRDRYGR